MLVTEVCSTPDAPSEHVALTQIEERLVQLASIQILLESQRLIQSLLVQLLFSRTTLVLLQRLQHIGLLVPLVLNDSHVLQKLAVRVVVPLVEVRDLVLLQEVQDELHRLGRVCQFNMFDTKLGHDAPSLLGEPRITVHLSFRDGIRPNLVVYFTGQPPINPD